MKTTAAAQAAHTPGAINAAWAIMDHLCTPAFRHTAEELAAIIERETAAPALRYVLDALTFIDPNNVLAVRQLQAEARAALDGQAIPEIEKAVAAYAAAPALREALEAIAHEVRAYPDSPRRAGGEQVKPQSLATLRRELARSRKTAKLLSRTGPQESAQFKREAEIARRTKTP